MRFTLYFLLLCGQLVFTRVAIAEVLTEEALRRLASENTITGRYTFGGWFSEYHSGDGRVLGNNGWQENVDACWTTKENAICYSYGKVPDRQTFCFTIEKNGESLMLRNLTNNTLNAIAKVETANPRNHSDSGHTWTCEDKVSNLRRKTQSGAFAALTSSKFGNAPR